MDLPLRFEVDRILSASRGPASAGLMNDLLVDFLSASGFVRSPGLHTALRRFRRDLFLPDAALGDVFSDRAVKTVEDPRGWVWSSCSTPSVTVSMIEALDVRPGDRILEIGTGTGYAAALVSQTADDVDVTSVEILPEEARAARRRLRDLAIANVHVVEGDTSCLGRLGRFDRILVSCGIEAIEPQLVDALRDGGRIVAPVGPFVYTLDKTARGLSGHPAFIADFIPCRSNRQVGADSWTLHGGKRDLAVHWAGRRPARLTPDDALHCEPAARTVGPTLPGDCLASVLLMLSTDDPLDWFQFCSESGGWGFGLVDDRGGVALVRLATGFTFRHYPSVHESTVFEIHGDEAPADRLFAIFGRLDEGGFPPPTRFSIEVLPITGADEAGSGVIVRGPHSWQYRLPEVAIAT